MKGQVGVVAVKQHVEAPGGTHQEHQGVDEQEVPPREHALQTGQPETAHHSVKGQEAEKSPEGVDMDLPGVLPSLLGEAPVESPFRDGYLRCFGGIGVGLLGTFSDGVSRGQ